MPSFNARTAHVVCRLLMTITLLAAASTAQAERLPLRLYTTADGLWSSAVNYVMRDSHGFIWLCTRDGLSRFDGYDFVNYRVNDDPASAYVNSIFETSKGVYWIITQGGSAYRFDPVAGLGSQIRTVMKTAGRSMPKRSRFEEFANFMKIVRATSGLEATDCFSSKRRMAGLSSHR